MHLFKSNGNNKDMREVLGNDDCKVLTENHINNRLPTTMAQIILSLDYDGNQYYEVAGLSYYEQIGMQISALFKVLSRGPQ